MFRLATLNYNMTKYPEDKKEWIDEIAEYTGLPKSFILWDPENKRIEIPLVLAEEISEIINAPISMIEVLPTHERLEVTEVRLNNN